MPKLVNGTTYNDQTPDAVISVLEHSRNTRERLRLFLGYETGESWNEEWGVTGFVGRSTGLEKIPILLHNSRSSGGGRILDHCIVAIKSKRGWLYQHKGFKVPETEIKEESEGFSLYLNGAIHACNLKLKQAQRLAEFMRGDRLTKGGK